MKIKHLLFESVVSNGVVFSVPSSSEEYDEVVYQLQQDKEHKFLPSWVRAALQSVSTTKLFQLKSRRDGQIVHIGPTEQKQIGNTGDSWEDSHWKPESIERVPKLFKSGKSITMPTILVNKRTGEKWLLGGHHRLTYNAQVLGNVTPCWAITFSPLK